MEKKHDGYSGGKPQINIQLFDYDKDHLTVTESIDALNFEGFQNPGSVSWLNIYGLSDRIPVETICANLGIHQLVLEDILDTEQRPKLQEFDDYLQFSIKSVVPLLKGKLVVEQISFILGKNYLLSFQERNSEYFNEIRRKLREKKGIIRERTADYLLFLLIDAILDNYFTAIDLLEAKTDKLVQFNADAELHPNVVFQIESIKTDVFLIKKFIEPLKTAILNIENDQGFYF